MSQPFLGQISIFGFAFPPRGYALCDGQSLAINQNQSLYSLLGTTYGGDGRTSFDLPDLRGRTPIHKDPAHPRGQTGGEETHTLVVAEMPAHTHPVQGSTTDSNESTPTGNILGNVLNQLYIPPANLTDMVAGSIGNAGSNQAHDNMQPYETISYCIALQGAYPSRN